MRSFCYPPLEVLSGVQSLNYSWEVGGACDTRDVDLYHSVGHAIHDQAIAALLLHPSALPPLSCSSILQCFKSLAVLLEAQQAHAQPSQVDTFLLESPRTERDT